MTTTVKTKREAPGRYRFYRSDGLELTCIYSELVHGWIIADPRDRYAYSDPIETLRRCKELATEWSA